LLVGRMLETGWTVTCAAAAAGISRRTAHKWLGRYAAEDSASLIDRSSRPAQSAGKAERFILTLLREWAYVRPYLTSAVRTSV
jgi:hypothetical protein